MPEDLAAFLPTAMCDDYQRLMKDRFLPVVATKFSVSEVNKGMAKIGLLSYPLISVNAFTGPRKNEKSGIKVCRCSPYVCYLEEDGSHSAAASSDTA